jgi:competence protein ComEC
MRDVMRAFKVEEVWDSGFNHPTKTYADMLQEIKDRGIKFATPKQGVTRQFGQVLVEVLHPGTELSDDNPNNASVVVRLTFGSKRFLFTGDAEIESWEQMIRTEKDKLRADLLKSAHHGSSNGTTQDVLEAVRPSVYTISCAVGNDYHHPHPKVMSLLEKNRNSIKVYRTDLQGTITAVSDGNIIEMSADRQVASDRLYLTGDEVAGKVAADTDGKMDDKSSKRSNRKSR